VRHGPSVGRRDQVDVLAQATGRQVRAGQGCTAEEDELAGMGLERGEYQRDQMVPMDLF
jgi:hypothetical protein